jgi:transposase
MSQLPARYKTYSPEFRDEAARMVVETSRDIADVARETSRELVRAYRKSMRRTSRHCRISDRARLREIERENRELRMKNEFLSKAAAYFAAEHG